MLNESTSGHSSDTCVQTSLGCRDGKRRLNEMLETKVIAHHVSHSPCAAIPGGLPVLGNLLQLTEKKPHRTFTAWSKEHGPIFTIKVGSVPQAVVNNSEIAKEVLVTKFASISKRQMPMALRVLTRDKTMVAMSDYGEEHRMLKKLVMTNLLGPTTQVHDHRVQQNPPCLKMCHVYASHSKGTPEEKIVCSPAFYRRISPSGMEFGCAEQKPIVARRCTHRHDRRSARRVESLPDLPQSRECSRLRAAIAVPLRLAAGGLDPRFFRLVNN